MAESKHMVPGFNHNVKHGGKAYHVQTEDSGLSNPRIVTHLFVGGNILASKKTSYGDLVGAENLTRVVRELMEEQHKEMLRNLVNGVYDEAEQSLSALATAFQPGQLHVEEQGGPEPAPEAAAPEAVAPEAVAPEAVAPEAVAPAAEPPPARPESPQAAPPPLPPPYTPPARPPRRRGAVAVPARPSPPAASIPPGAATPRPAPRPVPAAARPAITPGPAPTTAPPRPELVFDVPLSERSLDDVILSFLAEDMERRKP